jgi:hypothetical protein
MLSSTFAALGLASLVALASKEEHAKEYCHKGRPCCLEGSHHITTKELSAIRKNRDLTHWGSCKERRVSPT